MSGVTIIQSEDESLLVKVFGGIQAPGRSTLSTNQIRACGHRVYDIPRKFEGAQKLVLNDAARSIIPLNYKNGLLFLVLKRPTVDEARTMNIIHLTNENGWKPRDENDDIGTAKV